MFSASLFAQDNGNSGNDLASKYIEEHPELVLKVIAATQEIETAKMSLMGNLMSLEKECSKKDAKTLLGLCYEPEMYPLFEKVIDEAFTPVMNCTDAKKGLTNLFHNIYPEMLNTKVYTKENNIEILEIGLRTKALKAMAKGMIELMKDACSDAEEKVINAQLNEFYKYILFTEKPDEVAKYQVRVIKAMLETLTENNIKTSTVTK
jgi:hypothetical protein